LLKTVIAAITLTTIVASTCSVATLGP